MEVAAHNIANANSTRSVNGGPYRRQQALFASTMSSLLGREADADRLQGVRVAGVVGDDEPFPIVYQPGHPDADADGFVKMPNVRLPLEMVDLMTASRAYEANLKSLRLFKDMAEQALSLIGGR